MSDDLSYVHRVLAVFAFDGTDSVWWRTEGEFAPVTFFAQVSDFFAWGGGDLERIEPGDVDALEQAASDIRSAGVEPSAWAGELFAARKRGMRPQGAQFKYIPEPLWPLFKAAGPERARDLLNPKAIPEPEVRS